MIKNALECVDVVLKFNSGRTMQPTSLAIPVGAFVGVIGTNGAGKTFLLKTVLGVFSPIKGKILIFGKEHVSYIKEEKIGYLPQFFAFVPLKVRDFLRICCRKNFWHNPFSLKKEKQEIERVLSLVRADTLVDKEVSSLSGGERQKIFLAQALLSSPKLLILDEPFSSMDPAQTHEMIALLETIQKTTGVTILCATHEPFMMRKVLTHILYLKKEKIIMGSSSDTLTPQILAEIYDIPENLLRSFTAHS